MIKSHGPRKFIANAGQVRIGIKEDGTAYALIPNYTSMNISVYNILMVRDSNPAIPSQYRIITNAVGAEFTVNLPWA